jgi:phosphinothricin acetyltransferase
LPFGRIAVSVLQIHQTMIRNAVFADLPAVVDIYNASIPGRKATADLVPVSVAERQAWFDEFDPARRPLWIFGLADSAPVLGWLSLRSFYGRPAYSETVEVGIYTDPSAQRRGIGRSLLDHAITHAPGLGISTLLAFTFAHNGPSVGLFRSAGFETWGELPRVARLDGIARDLLILGRPL